MDAQSEKMEFWERSEEEGMTDGQTLNYNFVIKRLSNLLILEAPPLGQGVLEYTVLVQSMISIELRSDAELYVVQVQYQYSTVCTQSLELEALSKYSFVAVDRPPTVRSSIL